MEAEISHLSLSGKRAHMRRPLGKMAAPKTRRGGFTINAARRTSADSTKTTLLQLITTLTYKLSMVMPLEESEVEVKHLVIVIQLVSKHKEVLMK